MGAPISAGLKLFIRTTPLTDEDALVLVESQARIAKSIFEHTTLHTLERQVWIRIVGGGDRPLCHIRPKVSVLGVCTESTQGVFFATPNHGFFWGYTRDGLWVICRTVDRPNMDPPFAVDTVPSDIGDIVSALKVKPTDLVWRLQQQMEEIVEKRKQSLKDAETALRDMKTETRFYYILKESEQQT